MDLREFLVKAQEAEARAYSSEKPVERQAWENIAHEYRRLAEAARQIPGYASGTETAH